MYTYKLFFPDLNPSAMVTCMYIMSEVMEKRHTDAQLATKQTDYFLLKENDEMRVSHLGRPQDAFHLQNI